MLIHKMNGLMDRRSLLQSLFVGTEKEGSNRSANNYPDRNPVQSGLDPYEGEWSHLQAAHLLRRTMYGPTLEQINHAVELGLDLTLAQLIQPATIPEPPLNYYFENDPNVPIGSTWIDAPYPPGSNLVYYRNRSFGGWTMKNLFEEGLSITEKMIVFWHNHFVTADVNEPRFDYTYFDTIRKHSLGNFREFVKAMTVDPSMLRYLNGNQNTKNAPNENYARELLELFTIGKGPLAGPGDYTNYTEGDISEIARILTGWKDQGFRATDNTPVGSYFRSAQHDTGIKTLSARFDQAVIENEGEVEYKTLIDLIFTRRETARYICRKLYRWFVYHIIDPQTEDLVIEPMADLLIQHDFEIQPVLSILLSSQHFYDANTIGCLIKNPLDFLFSTVKNLEIKLPEEDLNLYYKSLLVLFDLAKLLQMSYGDPPSVAGWSAYYQGPSYYEIWINSVTLPYRMNFTKAITLAGIRQGQVKVIADVLSLVNKLENPSDIDSLLSQLIRLLFPLDLTDKQKQHLKDILIPGLPDYEWTIEYVNYLNNLEDESIVKSMENKLRILFDAMLSLPEFHLS